MDGVGVTCRSPGRLSLSLSLSLSIYIYIYTHTHIHTHIHTHKCSQKNYIRWNSVDNKDFIYDYFYKSQDYCNGEERFSSTLLRKKGGRSFHPWVN